MNIEQMAKFSAILIKSAKTLGNLAILAIVALTVYFIFIQSWHQRWGTTDDELHRKLPGDDLLPEPIYHCTHAITINAPVEEIWKWLLQIGQDRGGFYSYNWIENLFGFDIHNVYQIKPEWQHLEEGDTVWLTSSAQMRVAAVKSNRELVFDMPMATRAAWAFILTPHSSKTTRLIIRIRIKAERVPWLPFLIFDQGHFIMERKMMFTIKELAESPGRISTSFYLRELLWFISIIIAGIGILGLLFSKKFPWTLLSAAIGTILWVLLLFRGYPSPVYGALLVIGISGVLLRVYWPLRRSEVHNLLQDNNPK